MSFHQECFGIFWRDNKKETIFSKNETKKFNFWQQQKKICSEFQRNQQNNWFETVLFLETMLNFLKSHFDEFILFAEKYQSNELNFKKIIALLKKINLRFKKLARFASFSLMRIVVGKMSRFWNHCKLKWTRLMKLSRTLLNEKKKLYLA